MKRPFLCTFLSKIHFKVRTNNIGSSAPQDMMRHDVDPIIINSIIINSRLLVLSFRQFGVLTMTAR
jgi:hypothetical protein